MINVITKIDITPERMIITHESGRKVRLANDGTAALMSAGVRAPVAALRTKIRAARFVAEALEVAHLISLNDGGYVPTTMRRWLISGVL